MKKNNPLILKVTILKNIYIYFQGSKGDTDIEKRLVHTVGEGEGGTI